MSNRDIRQANETKMQKLADKEALETCTYCPRLCRDVCPVALAEANEALIPTHKIGLLELWQRDMLQLDEELARVLYACTDCGACTNLCKHKMKPAELLYEARQQAFAQGVSPAEVEALVGRMQTHGTPYGALPQHESLKQQTATTALFIGCACATQRPESIQSLRDALQRATGTPIGLFDPGACCGMPWHAAGAADAHEQNAKGLGGRFHQISHLIVADPHCFRHLQEHVTHGKKDDRRVSHAFAVLEPSIGVLSGQTQPKLAFYHDSAALGRFLGMIDEPRRLLGRLGYQLLEFTRHRDKAMATGAGGIYRWTSPEASQNYVKWLLQEARDVAAHKGLQRVPPIITVGETERSHLAKGAPDLEILDLNEILVGAMNPTQ